MRFFLKNRGSVSIFLVIILVPIIVVCSVFVDVSRIELAKGVADSAGDLTLNTMLTQYDRELNDYYGLMASSQNIDDFLVQAENYFEACMVSQGISTTEASKYADEISKMLNGKGQIVDFLQINPKESSASIVPMSEANLSNSVMMRNEMVEFMKYRSPLNNAMGFIDKMKGIEKGILEKPMEAELTDRKNEFYETESELLKEALEVYKLMLEYNELKITKEYIEELRTYLNDLEGIYKSLHHRLIFNWINTQMYYGQQIFPSAEKEITISPSSNCGYTSENTAEEGAVNQATSAFNTAKGTYESKRDNLTAIINGVSFDKFYDAGKHYDIQYWVQMAEQLHKGNAYTEFLNAAKAMFQAYANMQKTYECRVTKRTIVEKKTVSVESEDGEVDKNGKPVMVDKEVEETREEPVTFNQSTHDNYNAAVSGFTSIRGEFSRLDIIRISRDLNTISTKAINNETTLQNPATLELTKIYGTLKNYLEKLNKGMEIMRKTTKRLGRLKELAADYERDFRAWESYVKQSDATFPKNNMVDKDIGEIEEIQKTLGNGDNKGKSASGEFDKVNEIIDEEKISEMKKRCEDVNSLLGSFETGIKKYEYGSSRVYQIATYDSLKNAAGLSLDRITIVASELKAYEDELWGRPIFVKPRAEEIHEISDKNHPAIATEKPPKLYLWMANDKFKNYEEGKHQGGLDKFDNLKNQMSQFEKDNTNDKSPQENSEEEIRTKEELPSAGKGTSAKSGTTGDATKPSGDRVSAASNDMQDFTKGVNFDIAAAFKTVRDDLYIADYVMSMFSYDTYELEGKYNLLREGADENNVYAIRGGGKIDLSNVENKYADVADEWKTEDTTFYYNKSLTNKMINKKQNFSYGNEVEYVLYGGKNEENKSKANVTLFSMRYAMNIAPVFQEYWMHRLVLQIATSVTTLTSGVVPIPLVKMVICLGIIATETAVDMQYLKKGLPVLFFKKQEDLFLELIGEGKKDNARITGFGKKESLGDKSRGVYFSYRDYLYFFLFINCIGNNQSICLRTADVIQCNMQKVTQKDVYRMKKSIVYFEMNADIKVNPLMLELPFSRAEGADILDSSKWNSFTYHGIRGY